MAAYTGISAPPEPICHMVMAICTKMPNDLLLVGGSV